MFNTEKVSSMYNGGKPPGTSTKLRSNTSLTRSNKPATSADPSPSSSYSSPVRMQAPLPPQQGGYPLPQYTTVRPTFVPPPMNNPYAVPYAPYRDPTYSVPHNPYPFG